MVNKEISMKIGKAIKEIWMKNIPKDFSKGYIINEDCLKKLKDYVQKSKFQCPLYFAVIYEVECCWLHWLDKRSKNNWASGRVTELDAGWIDGIMNYEVHSY